MAGFGSIEELVAVVELKNLFVWEESAKRHAPSDGADATGSHDGEEKPLGFKVAVRIMEFDVGFRFRLQLEIDDVEYVSDIEAIYEVPHDGPTINETSRDIVQDFADRVAFMAVYPYVRTAIHGASGRLGASRPVLPIIRQGQFAGGEQTLSPEELEETFGLKAARSSPSGE